jgi:hypothetical protein
MYAPKGSHWVGFFYMAALSPRDQEKLADVISGIAADIRKGERKGRVIDLYVTND